MQTGTNSRDLFQPTCFTTTTAGRSSVTNILVSHLQSLESSSYSILELSLPDLSKLIGDEWKKLSENQKAVSTNQNYFFSLLSVSDSYH